MRSQHFEISSALAKWLRKSNGYHRFMMLSGLYKCRLRKLLFNIVRNTIVADDSTDFFRRKQQLFDAVQYLFAIHQIITGRRVPMHDPMKPTAVFVNTARAYMVDYDYLAKILAEKKITGAALEVFPVEPLPQDSPFIALDNVTLTNHRGGDTVNCFADCPEYLLTELYHYIAEGKRPRFIID